MDDKLFIIAIGGTGMRCLESFVHLCAAGMFDNKTIDILTLDTDQANGNKGRVEDLIRLYNDIKTKDPNNVGGDSTSDTFFSAKLNLYRFYTDYTSPERKTFRALSATRSTDQARREANRDLAALFFEPDTVQEFPLDHGYRAQTHLGSLLMYHGIVEAAIKAKRGGTDLKAHEKELQDFLQLLNNTGSKARVFVFGSVFGGTGASSIPVIPLALRDALKIVTGGNNDLDLNKVKFGSTLLTDYFTFDMPNDNQRQKDKVIADSNNFALNSQAAMNFYVNDDTVKHSYKLLYHIGWPSSYKINYSQGQRGDVITGGKAQENACHMVELMSASAAYDFFTREKLDQPEAEYVFRAVEENESKELRLTGESFVGKKDGSIFEEKLGSLLSLSHLILSRYGGAQEGVCGTKEFREDLKRRNVETFNDLKDKETELLDEYLKKYAYKIHNGYLSPGWLHQIKNSVSNHCSSFIFSDDALSIDLDKLRKVDPGAIYKDEKYNWQTSGLFGSKADKRMNKFIELLKSGETAPKEQQGESLKEKFIGNLYNAITKAQATSHLNQG